MEGLTGLLNEPWQKPISCVGVRLFSRVRLYVAWASLSSRVQGLTTRRRTRETTRSILVIAFSVLSGVIYSTTAFILLGFSLGCLDLQSVRRTTSLLHSKMASFHTSASSTRGLSDTFAVCERIATDVYEGFSEGCCLCSNHFVQRNGLERSFGSESLHWYHHSYFPAKASYIFFPLGHPYVANCNVLVPATQNHVMVPVYKRGGKLDAYTIIRAQPLADWVDGPEVSVLILHCLSCTFHSNCPQEDAQDHRLDGYKSTIGPSNFHEVKKNMLNHDQALLSVKRGQKPKINVLFIFDLNDNNPATPLPRNERVEQVQHTNNPL